jgi:hypothetical protein
MGSEKAALIALSKKAIWLARHDLQTPFIAKIVLQSFAFLIESWPQFPNQNLGSQGYGCELAEQLPRRRRDSKFWRSSSATGEDSWSFRRKTHTTVAIFRPIALTEFTIATTRPRIQGFRGGIERKSHRKVGQNLVSAIRVEIFLRCANFAMSLTQAGLVVNNKCQAL